MFFVVPTKKSLRESATVLNAAEAVGKLGTIFHGAELTLRIGIVIGDMRTAMGLGDSQVRQLAVVGCSQLSPPANFWLTPPNKNQGA